MGHVLLAFILVLSVNQNTGTEIYINEISATDFKVSWDSYKNNDYYDITLEGMESCDSTQYQIYCPTDHCEFILTEHCGPTQPCTDFSLNVTASNETSLDDPDGLILNTAPNVFNLEKMTLDVNGSIATLNWDSEDPDMIETKCATKAKYQLIVDGNDEDTDVVDIVLGESNTYHFNLDPCKGGRINAEVTYVTLLSEDKTTATKKIEADEEYSGVGIDEPPTVVQGEASCNVNVSWHSQCKFPDYYHLTWGDDMAVDTDDTSYTIEDLRAEGYTICVAAYVDDLIVGEELCNVIHIKQIPPGPTVIDRLGSEHDKNGDLTVFWTYPPNSTCAVVEGFQVTWRQHGMNLPTGSVNISSELTSYTITGMKECTQYEVNIAGYSNIGTGPSDKRTATKSEVLFDQTKQALESIKQSYEILLNLTMEHKTTTEPKITKVFATYTIDDTNCTSTLCKDIIHTIDVIHESIEDIENWTAENNKLSDLISESDKLQKLVINASSAVLINEDAGYINGYVNSMQKSLDDAIDMNQKKIDDYCSRERENMLIIYGLIAGAGLLLIVFVCIIAVVIFKKKRKTKNPEEKDIIETSLSDLQPPNIIPRATFNRKNARQEPYSYYQ